MSEQQHPLEGMMDSVMNNLKEMVDVNIILGDPVESPDGSVILPISRVGYGFAVGGTEFSPSSQQGNDDSNSEVLPFGGGSGGGVSISPVGFLIVNSKGSQMIHIDKNAHLAEKLIDLAPQAIEKIQDMMKNVKTDSNSDANREEKDEKQ
ncbi:GerW family sporulation protein [Aquibacillus salsiterrae]|uniref:GerW family sporulation protein n=1 Tax=Aquibacillus salsiterrae TaxID=2950439 RepID=A0A9X3WD02_9BACI|nr:GerW family sporulation protein [Aquibacillus salsiterrae]MDC3415770.1 GerW family sporulation protein [Aquibacillus salsiterrae]